MADNKLRKIADKIAQNQRDQEKDVENFAIAKGIIEELKVAIKESKGIPEPKGSGIPFDSPSIPFRKEGNVCNFATLEVPTMGSLGSTARSQSYDTLNNNLNQQRRPRAGSFQSGAPSAWPYYVRRRRDSSSNSTNTSSSPSRHSSAERVRARTPRLSSPSHRFLVPPQPMDACRRFHSDPALHSAPETGKSSTERLVFISQLSHPPQPQTASGGGEFWGTPPVAEFSFSENQAKQFR